MVTYRGGVLEDVFGLKDTFWWPWPRRSSPWLHVLKNCPVLGSRTAVFFELLKFCRVPEKNFWKLFFGEHLRLCPWSLALASSIPVLGLDLGRAVLYLGPGFFLCPWPWALCLRLHLWWPRWHVFPVVSLEIMTPGADFRAVTLHK